MDGWDGGGGRNTAPMKNAIHLRDPVRGVWHAKQTTVPGDPVLVAGAEGSASKQKLCRQGRACPVAGGVGGGARDGCGGFALPPALCVRGAMALRTFFFLAADACALAWRSGLLVSRTCCWTVAMRLCTLSSASICATRLRTASSGGRREEASALAASSAARLPQTSLSGQPLIRACSFVRCADASE